MNNDQIYATDFYLWAKTQANLLRAGQFTSADIFHIIEELDGMGKSEHRELINRLEILLMHLLKWQYQPSLQSKSWQFTIREQRMRIADHLEDNPSLKYQIEGAIIRAYRLARIGAERETGLDIFPESCPYNFNQLCDNNFLP